METTIPNSWLLLYPSCGDPTVLLCYDSMVLSGAVFTYDPYLPAQGRDHLQSLAFFLVLLTAGFDAWPWGLRTVLEV